VLRIFVILLGFLLTRCGASDDSNTDSSSFSGKYVLKTVRMSSASGLHNATGLVSAGECSLALTNREPGIYDFVHVSDCYVIFNGQLVPVRSRNAGTIEINDDGQAIETSSNSAASDSTTTVFSSSGSTKTVIVDIDGELVTYIYEYVRQ
jgi:hypothetical protein